VGQIATIVVAPDSVSLPSGTAETFRAQAQTTAAGAVSGATFFWSTSDSAVATVTQSGVVTGHQPGAAKISASAQGMSGFARVIVVQPVVSSVRITPSSDTIYATKPGDTTTLSGLPLDSAGRPLTGHPLLWTVNGTIAAVSGGIVTATGTNVGKVTVTATSTDTAFVSGAATVTVLGHTATIAVSPSFAWLSTSGAFFLSRTVQLSALLTDTFGNDVSGHRAIRWSTANPSIATVNKNGVVSAVATTSGSTSITATTPDGKSAVATITVFP
jgi:uncharacterized protein YjdB